VKTIHALTFLRTIFLISIIVSVYKENHLSNKWQSNWMACIRAVRQASNTELGGICEEQNIIE
jgi:hypothetical protein